MSSTATGKRGNHDGRRTCVEGGHSLAAHVGAACVRRGRRARGADLNGGARRRRPGLGPEVRVNVYLPDELNVAVRTRIPGVNVSAVLQRALQDLLECEHRRLVCAECASPIDMRERVDEALCSLYLDLHWRLVELVDRGGTAEGAARIAKDVALRHRVSCAPNLPLPRPTRAQRQRQRVLEFPDAPITVVDRQPKEQTA
jgi:post-segregation antitoxin (ccd killing protein)